MYIISLDKTLSNYYYPFFLAYCINLNVTLKLTCFSNGSTTSILTSLSTIQDARVWADECNDDLRWLNPSMLDSLPSIKSPKTKLYKMLSKESYWKY